MEGWVVSSVGLVVADNGIGIPADELPCLWRDFFRASNARQSSVSGTGLGLAIVKAIAEAHGGTASVSSKGKGKGATFSISLPRRLV